MHESEVRAALLLATIEADRGGDDAASAADRVALDRATRAATSAAPGSDAWIRARTRLAWERLLPARDPGSAPARAWLDRRSAIGSPILVAMVLAFILGAGIDRLAGAPYLRLVEPAIWALIAFNLGVYLLLAIGALAPQSFPTSAASGGLRRLLGRLVARASPPPKALARIATPEVLAGFAREWREASTTLDAARLRAILHASAAALAAGVIAGLYARGLTTDYAVGWESTFLDTEAMHAWVHALLGPAAMLAGLPLPDRDAVAAWRVVPGGIATGNGAAAPLIHLHALSLVVAVVLPRAGLAAVAWWRALRLRRDFPVPERLRALAVEPASREPTHLGRLELIAHGPLEPARAESLLAALPNDHGARPREVAAGDEDTVPLPADADTVLVLVAMTATPEAETHGRLLARLRLALPSARCVLVVDAEPFERRFGAWPARMAERRAAWQAFATQAGAALAVLDLAHGDGAAWRTSLARSLAVSDDDSGLPR